MSDHYSPATLTPVSDVKREVEVKTEPSPNSSSRVNGYGNVLNLPTNCITVMSQQHSQQQQPQPPQQSTGTSSSAASQHQTQPQNLIIKQQDSTHQVRYNFNTVLSMYYQF